MDLIKSTVDSLCKKYSTRNPFELAKCLDIHITTVDLHHDIKGFYQYHKRNRFIYLNSNLEEYERYFVCGHELGHAILHKNLSTPFMRQKTLFSIDKIEREANRFAAELLIPDDILLEYKHQTIEYIASMHNVPLELAKLKCEKLF